MTNYNYTKLQPYVNFKTKDKLDEQVANFRNTIGYKLNDTDNKLLTYMMQYSVRYTGVFYQLVDTIANNLKVSVATVKRVLSKITKLGIVKRIPTTRKTKGGKGATIFQFQYFTSEPLQVSHCDNYMKPYESKREGSFVETKPFIFSNKELKDIKTYKNVLTNEEVESILKVPFHEMSLSDKVKSLVSATIGEDKVKEVNRVVFSKVNQTLKLATFKPYEGKVKEIVFDALKTSLNALKQGKARNLFAYLNGVIERKLDALTFELLNDIDIDSEPVAVHGKLENWLLE